MNTNSPSKLNRESKLIIILSIFIGFIAYALKIVVKSGFFDPLLVSLIIGIIGGTLLNDGEEKRPRALLASRIFIPIGTIFYAMKNLNFVKIGTINPTVIILLIIVVLTYYGVILLLGKWLKAKRKIIYLTATGSAICGASAIAITAPAVDAEPDDIAISLLSVSLTAFFGLSILLPFVAVLFGLTGKEYSILSGGVLQLTGFVEIATGHIPHLVTNLSVKELTSLGLSVKAIRYLGLLIAIPLFASLLRKKFYIPWFMWFFVGAGLLGTELYLNNHIFYTKTLLPIISPIYSISWSVAMAAIGFNADAKQLFSHDGTKSLLMSFGGFFVAITVFLIGMQFF